MKAPRVSVVIPCYNSAPYVTQAIRSVLAQTYDDYEIILVDDGSTDDLIAALNPVINKIRYVKQNNAGTAAARNRGFHEATGSLIAFLDADDLWLPNKLELQVAELDVHTEVDVLHTSWISYLPDGSLRPFIKAPLDPMGEAQRIILSNCVMTSSVLIRRSSLEGVGGFRESILGPEDLDLWLRLTAAGSVFGTLEEPVTIYRILEESKTRQHCSSPEISAVIRSFFDSNTLPPALTDLRDLALGRSELSRARGYLLQGDMEGFKRQIASASQLLALDSQVVPEVATMILPDDLIDMDRGAECAISASMLEHRINEIGRSVAEACAAEIDRVKDLLRVVLVHRLQSAMRCKTAIAMALYGLLHSKYAKPTFAKSALRSACRIWARTAVEHSDHSTECYLARQTIDYCAASDV